MNILEKKYDGAIFDLDGVIVDTAKYHYLAWKRLASEMGFEFLPEHNELLKGVSRMKSLDILLETGGITLDEAAKTELAEEKNEWYREYIHRLDESEILPGAKEVLAYLKKKGIRIALGSASKNARLILQRLKLEDYFDFICDGTMVSNAKPDPEVFLTAAARLCLDPEKCVVFEDAKAGIDAARNAGMASVGVGKREVLEGADMVIGNLSDKKVYSLF